MAAVTFPNRIGQRVADYAVQQSGGMQIMAGGEWGGHAAAQPTHRGNLSSTFHIWAYVEGWGGNIFQADEVLIKKDTMLSRYKNENLVLHEGGHGMDSFTASGSFAPVVRTDLDNAHTAATNINNGRRYYDQFNTGAYLSARGEMMSTGVTYWAGAMREQFRGINDGTWTPINSREELFRYDPFGFESFKRSFFNDDLGMWYYDANGNPRVGDPDYRVIPEDWELLADTYEEFEHWKTGDPHYGAVRGVDNLIAWASSIHETARYNPYTGQSNPLINWISWNTPNVWGLEYVRNPSNANCRYDFERHSYYPEELVQNQTHPFFREGGVVRPQRSAELLELVKPVVGEINNVRLIGGHRANIIRFEFTDYEAPITMNNAPTSFEAYIDGELTHFTFYFFRQTAPGVATVDLRLEWPVLIDAEVEVSLRATPMESATATARVAKLSGNQNDLIITVTELYANGVENVFTAIHRINNNSSGTFKVGDHMVYASTRDNTVVSALRIVSSDPQGPIYHEKGVPVLISATTSSDSKDVTVTGSNVWDVSFKVTEVYSDGTVEVVPYTVKVNKNSSGRADLGAYTLIYDITGNGSNLKTFMIAMK